MAASSSSAPPAGAAAANKRKKFEASEKTRGDKRKKKKEGMIESLDLISNLPDCVLTSVLSLLPLKESARTSVLSRRWRNLWALAPISIDSDSFTTSLRVVDVKRWYGYVTRAISSRHRGPIHSFHLGLDELDRYLAAADGGLEILARRGIRHLKVGFSCPTQLPSCFFSCKSLETLDVVGCKLPAEFPENNLRELTLRRATLTSNQVSNLLSCSPLLDCLSLLDCTLPGDLRISSLSLQKLEINGNHIGKDIVMEEVPNLMFLTIEEDMTVEVDATDMQTAPKLVLNGFANLREVTLRKIILTSFHVSHLLSCSPFLDCLSLLGCTLNMVVPDDLRVTSLSLQKLTITGTCNVKELTIEDVPKLELLMLGEDVMETPDSVVLNASNLRLLGFVNANLKMLKIGDTCISLKATTHKFSDVMQRQMLVSLNTHAQNLKTLAIKVNFLSYHQTKNISMLLRCLPCLENLDILCNAESTWYEADAEYWELERSTDCLDRHLKFVKIKKFRGKANDISFAKYLLRNASVLEVMTLFWRSKVKTSWEEIKHQQLCFESRASTDAQVIFMKDYARKYQFSTWETLFD